MTSRTNWLRNGVLLALMLTVSPNVGASLPRMTWLWEMNKTEWGGTCSGKNTHFMTADS